MTTRKCTNGHALEAGQTFCTTCGEQAPRQCQAGHLVDSSDFYCPQCGADLAEQSAVDQSKDATQVWWIIAGGIAAVVLIIGGLAVLFSSDDSPAVDAAPATLATSTTTTTVPTTTTSSTTSIAPQIATVLESPNTDLDPSRWSPSANEPAETMQQRVFGDTDWTLVAGFPVTMNGCASRQIRTAWRSVGEEVQPAIADYWDPSLPEVFVNEIGDPAIEGEMINNGCEQPAFKTPSGNLTDIVVEVSVFQPAVGG